MPRRWHHGGSAKVRRRPSIFEAPSRSEWVEDRWVESIKRVSHDTKCAAPFVDSSSVTRSEPSDGDSHAISTATKPRTSSYKCFDGTNPSVELRLFDSNRLDVEPTNAAHRDATKHERNERWLDCAHQRIAANSTDSGHFSFNACSCSCTFDIDSFNRIIDQHVASSPSNLECIATNYFLSYNDSQHSSALIVPRTWVRGWTILTKDWMNGYAIEVHTVYFGVTKSIFILIH